MAGAEPQLARVHPRVVLAVGMMKAIELLVDTVLVSALASCGYARYTYSIGVGTVNGPYPDQTHSQKDQPALRQQEYSTVRH